MSVQPAIGLQKAGVNYRRYEHPRDALLEWLLRRPRHTLFHALQDISFSLQAGQSLGIVGDNGAGKSTLLKLLAGTLQPTSGHCEVNGRVGALLELGTGLNADFSGEDNARLGLALRGLDSNEIKQQLPNVLEFAELGDFAKQAVKTYSSGMAVRLAFAIAAVLEPQVLIVDEALSVGDQYFQKKSLDRMRSILHNGATLVFCSHNLYQVRELCQQAIWLEHGRLRLWGDAQTVVDAYQDAVRAKTAPTTASATVKTPLTSIANKHTPHLLKVTLDADVVHTHAPFAVTVELHPGAQAPEDIHVGIVIRRNDEVQCYGISTLHDGIALTLLRSGLMVVRMVIEQLPLLSGDYCLEVWLIDGSGVHVYDSHQRCCPFHVQQANQQQGIGMVWLAHRWETVSMEPRHVAAA